MKKLLNESENAHEKVIKHWQSIIDGIPPFGYIIKEED